ncbi:Serine/Threonine-kinase [Medicago truncatula]|uniref:Serine/Threonine-kinase n=1 Tax=Medicago truncatula TaxID=3880 RepID=G7JZE3_MEDTR|nr:Serine/Threonine-kinase [Medicago truncatula]
MTFLEALDLSNIRIKEGFKIGVWIDCQHGNKWNCSCTTYTSLDPIGAGKGCSISLGDLIDLRTSQHGQDLYVRMDSTYIGKDFKTIYICLDEVIGNFYEVLIQLISNQTIQLN